MNVNYKELEFYQQYWKESWHIPTERATALTNLSNLFIEKAKANADNVDDVVLLYPEDCSDREVFMEFARLMSAFVTNRNENDLRMDGWYCNREVDVD